MHCISCGRYVDRNYGTPEHPLCGGCYNDNDVVIDTDDQFTLFVENADVSDVSESPGELSSRNKILIFLFTLIFTFILLIVIYSLIHKELFLHLK